MMVTWDKAGLSGKGKEGSLSKGWTWQLGSKEKIFFNHPGVYPEISLFSSENKRTLKILKDKEVEELCIPDFKIKKTLPFPLREDTFVSQVEYITWRIVIL